MSADVLATVAGMAAVGYGVRAAGVWLGTRRGIRGRGGAFLEHAPGALLTALVVPPLVAGGPGAWAGALCTLWLVRRTGSALGATVAGTLLVVLLRALQGTAP